MSVQVRHLQLRLTQTKADCTGVFRLFLCAAKSIGLTAYYTHSTVTVAMVFYLSTTIHQARGATEASAFSVKM